MHDKDVGHNGESGSTDQLIQQQGNEVSSRKIEANRQNSQRSTGPKTAEGKAKSAQNAIKHGIFTKHFLSEATPETVEEVAVLEASLREFYQPVGAMEELLVDKIIVEIGRRGRILSLEQKELARKHAFFGPAVDRVARYATTTDRALFRAVEQLERMQVDRKSRATSVGNADSANSTATPKAGEVAKTSAADNKQPAIDSDHG